MMKSEQEIKSEQEQHSNSVLESLIKDRKDSWTSEAVRTQTKIIGCI